MTEMEMELRRAEIEAETKVRVAKIENKQHFNRDALLFFLGVVITLVLAVGGGIGQHMYHSYNHNKEVTACQQAGGIWDTKTIRVWDGAREHDNDYLVDYCNLKH